ncbi:glycosyltransferase, partial [Chlamydiota bacterium]
DISKINHPILTIFDFKQFSHKTAKDILQLNGNVILFFGFVRKYKGLEYLIKAMPRIINEVPATLIIAGEFWHNKDEILQLINQFHLKKNIKIIDKYISNEEVEVYFKACDLVVLPYISATGSGIAQIAFSFEKPVIATNVGCFLEIIKHGKTGYLVHRGDSQSLSTAVIKFFKKRKSSEFIPNIQVENKKYSWNPIILEIEKFLNNQNI